MIKDEIVNKTIETLVKKYPGESARINVCVNQTARLWNKKDGNSKAFRDFCRNNFMTGENLETLFIRFEGKLESINGHFTALLLKLRNEIDEDTGPLHPVDGMFASWSPSAHCDEDMFTTKLAFMVLLNFPASTLEECLEKGGNWSRGDWAKTRLAAKFAYRTPAEVNQQLTKAYSEAERYINTYNIFMDKIVGGQGVPMFRKGLKLISHWGLRDELKGLYSNPAENLDRQKTIQTIMERIIRQEIPQKAVNSDKCNWNPAANTMNDKPADREPDTRYARLLDIFKAHLEEDKYYPALPTHIDRKFKLQREIPEAEVEKMFVELLTAKEGKETADHIKTRLGRDLEPFDIWYDGFKSRAGISEGELDKTVSLKYPDVAAFQRDIPNILQKLGFSKETAEFVAARVEVNAARGAGHAWGPGMRTEKAHLRTRVPKNGMNYQGFNVAMHELGHCTEQVFSLYKMDHTLLEGVPNTAFTEGFAFVFQDRDMEILEMQNHDEKAALMKTLDTFWGAREIAGVALVDMNVWRWLYNQDASPEDLRQAVVSIASGIWDKYYAPIFGVTGSPVLAIYSHMITYGMYLPDYPLGHIIAFQVEEYFKTHKLAEEMERMCRLGRITPKEWMKQAIGAEISPAPMTRAAGEAIKKLNILISSGITND